MENTGLDNQSTDNAKFKWYMRVQSYVYELWTRISKGTPNRQESPVGSSQVSLLLPQTQERGSGSEVVLGNFAKTQTVEKLNMANPKLVVTMDFVDESGESAADVVATFKKMSYEQIVNTQKAVAGSILGLGDLNVAAKASA